MSDHCILSIKNLSKYYPGVQALDDVSIDFYEGEVHALIGENGAGKSTLIKMISGAAKPDGGVITFHGKNYEEMSPHLSKALGIEVIYQEFNLIPTLSVAENVFMGDEIKVNGMIDRKTLIEKTKSIFQSMKTNIDPMALVEDLPIAYMQLVEIAKSISRQVKVLIMDEPTAPLSNSEVEILFQLVRELKNKGVTIIYISHRLPELFEISDRLTVMRDGKKIITLNTAETTKKELIKYMVGREITETCPRREFKPGEVILEVKNITGNGVKDIFFKVRKGEIFGLGGLVGAGRTELVRLLFGADKLENGEIWLEERKVRIQDPRQAVKLGFGLVPEDRKQHGAIQELSIRWNITLPILQKLSRLGVINRKKEDDCVTKHKDVLEIKTPSVDQAVKNLSGGNQQKVVLSKWMASQSKILIFDEPTRGVDVGAKQEIYKFMNNLARQGIAIIMISSEMEELLGMSDRILVLCEGRVMGELQKEEFSQENVLSLASGNN